MNHRKVVLFGADGRYLFVWADVEARMKNYNMHCMPMVVLLNLGEDALVVRRQGYEGVPQNTGLPEWLTDGERGQSDANTD